MGTLLLTDDSLLVASYDRSDRWNISYRPSRQQTEVPRYPPGEIGRKLVRFITVLYYYELPSARYVHAHQHLGRCVISQAGS